MAGNLTLTPDGGTAAPPPVPGEFAGSIPRQVRTVLDSAPDRLAVRDGRGDLPYDGLERQWVTVAGALADDDSERPIAVLLSNDRAGVVATLAAMETSRPVAIVDPLLPVERLRDIVELSEASTCVYGRASAETYDSIRDLFERSIAVDLADPPDSFDRSGSPAPDRAGRPAPPVDSRPGPLIMFTSGSTGHPKGVVCGHHVFAHDAWSKQRNLGINGSDRVFVLPALAFMLGASSAWGTLLAGAGLHLYDPRVRGLSDLLATLDAVRPTVLVSSPAALRAVTEQLDRALEGSEAERIAAARCLSELRVIDCGGERIPWSAVAQFVRHTPAACVFANGVGSTETALRSQFLCRMDDPMPDDGYVPAGTPVAGKEVRLLAEDGSEVAAGEVGEIAVVSSYLADGYWREPELSAEKFVSPPGQVPYFRTGDVGRLAADGSVHMLGRLDDQCKIRGYLVEPAEVERALLEIASVTEACVLADRSSGDARLIAYVVVGDEATASQPVLRKELAIRLPEYMVPSVILFLPELPRNERTKIDRAQLPPPPRPAAPTPPRNEWERALSDLWGRVLGLCDVGVHDDFFDLGGDSLAAEEMFTALTEEFGLPAVGSTALIEAPTIAQFAERIEWRSDHHRDGVVPLRPTGDRPPLFAVAGAGGLALALMGLARRLGDDQPVIGLQAHGLEERGLPDFSIRQAAARHVRSLQRLQPGGPYHLIGYSFGGLVAIEMAHLLVEAGQEVAYLGLIDTFLPRSRAWRGRRSSDEPSWRQRPKLSTAVKLPLAGLVPFRHGAQFEVFFMHGFVVSRLARLRPWPGPTHLYFARDEDRGAGVEEWSDTLTGPRHVRFVSGNHVTLVREPHVIDLAGFVQDDLTRASVPSPIAPPG